MPKETRERIIEAAFRTLSRRGYEKTTIKDIAEEADVAPGLIHYYFKSKQALVLVVLEVCCAELKRNDVTATDQGIVEAFQQVKAHLAERRDALRLYVELIGVGFHDPEVGAGLLKFLREDRGSIQAVTQDVFAARELPGEQASAFGAAVWAAVHGITVQALVDPDFDADAAVDALAAMAIATVTSQAELS